MRVLITVKAYPQLSRTYGETVCVAGVRLDATSDRWVRLYPVTFRGLRLVERFTKYQVVSLRAFRSGSDHRVESYKPVLSSVELGEVIGTDQGRWYERWRVLTDVAGDVTACELYRRQDEANAPSLGLVKPIDVLDLDIEPNDQFSADQQRLAALAASGDLFQAARAPLEPAPFRMRYRYRCAESRCRGHSQTLIDWEAGAASRRMRHQGRTDIEAKALLRDKFLDELCGPGRDTYFYLGNQHQRPKGFLVLGVFWPPVGSRPEPTLFDLD